MGHIITMAMTGTTNTRRTGRLCYSSRRVSFKNSPGGVPKNLVLAVSIEPAFGEFEFVAANPGLGFDAANFAAVFRAYATTFGVHVAEPAVAASFPGLGATFIKARRQIVPIEGHKPRVPWNRVYERSRRRAEQRRAGGRSQSRGHSRVAELADGRVSGSRPG